jgi:hypothetical protein
MVKGVQSLMASFVMFCPCHFLLLQQKVSSPAFDGKFVRRQTGATAIDYDGKPQNFNALFSRLAVSLLTQIVN